MAHRFDNDVEFVGNISGGGAGNLVIGNAVSVNRRTPADVMNVNDTMFIKIEETGQHETTLCTLISSTEMVRTRVIDRWDRTGALVTPIQGLNLTKVNFSTGQVYCAGTLPQPINIVLQPDGTFAYSDEVRKTVVFPLITGIQDPLSNILDGQIVFAANGLVNGDGLGGLFLYDQDGDSGTINNVDIYAPGTVGSPRPGILIRQRMDIMAAFFRQDLSIYTPVGGSVVRRKIHSLARGAAGADDAWMGEVVQRGTDANGAYTDLIQTARDRQAAEAGYVRHRSYETAARAFDVIEFLKPFKFSTVATTADVKPGMCARVAADEKLYHNDPDRGLSQILLSDGGPRATVENIAGIRLLTPDGYQDNEVVVVEGALFRGDGDSFLAYWSSGSSTADDGVTVFKPTLHASGAPWVEPGRFIAFSPVRAIKFADSDATPSVRDGVVFTAPDVAPVGGITGFDDFRNNKRIKLQPGAVDVQIVQANGALELPGRTSFTLPSVANGGSPVIFEKENGVVSMIAGGGAGGVKVADLTALSALGGFSASRDRERVYVKSLSTEYEYRDNLADATDDLIVVPALGGGTKKWGLPTYLKAQGVDLADLGVDPTGATDIYPVLLKAINAAKVRGGMVKFPGSGKFRLATATSLDIAGVKLVGVGKVDRNTSDPDASLIEIRQSSVAPFTAGDGTVLEGLSFDYPDQVDSATPTNYAPLIDGTNWRHGGAYLLHVMRAWDFAHLGGALVNQVCGALEFTGNRIFAINKTLRIRAAPEVIDLDSNHFSQNAFEDFAFPLLNTYSLAFGIGVEIYDAASAAWGTVDGLTVSKTNFIFGKRTAFQITDGLLNISQIGGLIDGCERWFQVLTTGRVANSALDGFGWADNAQNSLLTAIELGSTVDAENSLDVSNVNILNAGGTAIAVINSPAGASHKTKLRIRDSAIRNFGGDNLATDRHGVFNANPKAEIFVTGSYIKGRADETAHIGVFASAGVVHVSSTTFDDLTYPVWSRGTAVINVGADVQVVNTKVNAGNPSGAAYFTNETGRVDFKTKLGASDKVFDVTQFGAVADSLQSSAARNVAAFDAAVAKAAANGGGIVYWPASPLEYYITNTRADTGNTFDQVACCIESDNIHVKGAEMGATKIRLADGGNATMFRIGTRITRLGVKNSHVTDLSLDGNRANQAAVQALTHHFNGVEICNDGAEYCSVKNVACKQLQYYSGGGEYGVNGAQNCSVENFYSEDSGADGWDWKDNGSNGYGNSINGMWIERFGLASAVLTDQAGLDTRTGVKSHDVHVTDYGAAAGLNGIRLQRGGGSNFNQVQASSVSKFYCRPSTNVGTRGVRISQINAGLVDGEILECGTAYLISQRELKAANCWAYSCVDGWQLQDGIVGETNADNCMLTNCGSRTHSDEGLRLSGTIVGNEFHGCNFSGGAKGITIDAGVTNSRFVGGRCSANTTYNLQNNAPFGASNIFDNVEGISGNLIQLATGTWTPTVAYGTPGDFVPTYLLQQARYFQVGAEITVFGTVEWTSNAHTTAAGELRIGGLPFAAATALARYSGSASRMDNVDWPAGTPWQQVNSEISQTANYMRLRAARDAAAGFIADVAAFPASGTYRIDFSITYTRA